MENAKYFRDLGWAQLQGRWGEPVVFTLVYMLIAALWVRPYMSATCAHYYEYVKEEYSKQIVV